MVNSEKTFEILIIDDNPADATLMEHAWAECKDVKSNVTILPDARKALGYLRGGNVPDLIMLDYRHPMNGGRALSEIKQSADHSQVPVVVMSGSSNPRDYLEAYRSHANICFRKPLDADEYFNLVCQVASLWLLKAVLPTRN